mgnify:FL=1
MHTIAEKKLLMLKPSEIRPSLNRPRREFDEYELQALADSISENGIIQPISVRRTREGHYELISGERRLRAAAMAGLRRVPCILHKVDDCTAAVYAVVENMQRSRLGFFEEAQSLDRIIDLYGLSQSEAAVRFGMSRTALSSKLRLLRLSRDQRKRITDAGLTERHARSLLRLPDYKRDEALDRMIKCDMAPDEADELVFNILNPEYTQETRPQPERTVCEEKPEPVRKVVIGDVRLFSNSLTKLVDTLQSAGINASARKYENERYIEYKVRIGKESPESGRFKQLKIC